MSIRPLILSTALILCAGMLAAQQYDAVPAIALGPKTISRSSGRNVTLNFGLQPLVHGPYTLVVHNERSADTTIVLNGTDVSPRDDFRPDSPRLVTLHPANTLEVTFNDGWRDSAVTISIFGWKYKYAGAYPGNPAFKKVPPPDNNPSGPDTDPDLAFSWSGEGVVTPVKNQGASCPASWAFSTTGAVESYWAINHGELPSLSEQQILDCSGVRSCASGNTAQALHYAITAGLTPEDAYPYTGRIGTCKVSSGPYQFTAFTRVPAGDENALMEAVQQEPVSVVLNGNWFSSYTGGVAAPDCDSHPPVFVSALIVGYGYDPVSGFNYWEVKNSLGTSWGEHGYFRIVLGENICGIADYALYPR